jgi:hypothetical protein
MALDVTLDFQTNPPVHFDLSAYAPADFTTAGKTWKLIVEWGDTRKVYAAGSGLEITGAKALLWTFSIEDSILFPAGRQASIRLQWSEPGSPHPGSPHTFYRAAFGMLTIGAGIPKE